MEVVEIEKRAQFIGEKEGSFPGEKRFKLNDSIQKSTDFSIKKKKKCSSAVTFLLQETSHSLFFRALQIITALAFHGSPARTSLNLKRCHRNTAALQQALPELFPPHPLKE